MANQYIQFPGSTTTVAGTVTVLQGTSPWVVSGTVTFSNSTIAVTQSTSPWVISFTSPQHVIVDSGVITSITNTVTVSGTVSAAQSGTWNITNISGTISLPTGASTETTLSNLNVKFATSAALSDAFANPTTTQVGSFIFGYNGTTWDRLRSTTANGLVVDVSRVQGTVAVTQSTSPWVVSGTVTIAPSGTQDENLKQINGTTVLAGNGVTGAGSQRVTIASDNTAFTINAAQSGSWSVTANAGTNLNTSALALDATVSGLHVAQGSTTSGQTGPLGQSATTTNAPTYTTAKTNPLSSDTSGNLRVSLKDSPANTNKFLVTADPITFASAQAVTQSGTWTVQPGNTANTTAWKVDGSAVTQPVSISGNQAVNVAQINGVAPLMGNGVTGTGSQRVTIASDNTAFTVNAAQSGTWNITNVSGTVSLPTGASTESTLAKLTQTQGSTTSGQSGPLVQGAVTTAAPTYTTGQTAPLSLDTTGALRTSSTFSPSGTQDVNVKQIGAATVLAGNGVTGTGSQRVTIASDNTAFTVNSAQSGTWTVQPGNTANTTPWLVSSNSTTSGGMSFFRNTALSNTAVAVKASAGNVYYIHFYNTNTSDCFVQLYNVAQGSVTVGTTTPDITFTVPGGNGILDTSFDSSPFSCGTAITIAATTTITGGTAPGTGLLVSMGFK